MTFIEKVILTAERNPIQIKNILFYFMELLAGQASAQPRLTP
jgi:hypothetical protein